MGSDKMRKKKKSFSTVKVEAMHSPFHCKLQCEVSNAMLLLFFNSICSHSVSGDLFCSVLFCSWFTFSSSLIAWLGSRQSQRFTSSACCICLIDVNLQAHVMCFYICLLTAGLCCTLFIYLHASNVNVL